MTARVVLAGMLMLSIVAGLAMYYLQVYAFYEELSADQIGPIEMTSFVSGAPEPILVEDLEAIDADSSPIRFRACFRTDASLGMLTETFMGYDQAEPLVAPDWFSCFDAEELGAALENGDAIGFLGHENIEYGIDRVVAVMVDGRGYVWHQINPCGEALFDGDPVPETCPPAPERTR